MSICGNWPAPCPIASRILPSSKICSGSGKEPSTELHISKSSVGCHSANLTAILLGASGSCFGSAALIPGLTLLSRLRLLSSAILLVMASRLSGVLLTCIFTEVLTEALIVSGAASKSIRLSAELAASVATTVCATIDTNGKSLGTY